MCMQCQCATASFGEVLPGFYLVRARRDEYGKDDDSMKTKDWGLVQSNDPCIIWQETPVLGRSYWNFYTELYCSPDIGHKLIEAIRQVRNESNSLPRAYETDIEWLYKHLAKCIQENEILEDTRAERLFRGENSDEELHADWTYDLRKP